MIYQYLFDKTGSKTWTEDGTGGINQLFPSPGMIKVWFYIIKLSGMFITAPESQRGG
jgi:hypothetical protein